MIWRTRQEPILNKQSDRDLRLRGRLQGKILADPSDIRKEITHYQMEEINLTKNKIMKKKTSLMVRLEFKENTIKQLEHRIAQLRNQTTIMWTERFAKPHDYAIFKGIFYMILSVILILADVPILGRAIQQFMPDIPWINANTGLTFTQTFFSNPIEAFTTLPDLFLPVISILCLGFFIKPWLDQLTQPTNNTSGGSKYLEPSFIVITIFLLLSIMTIASMAYVRFSLPDSTPLQGFVSGLIGFALPYISAGFFMKSYTVIANRINLVSYAVRARYQAWLLEEKSKGREKILADIAQLDHELSICDSPGNLTNLVELKFSEFYSGYSEGVTELFNNTGGEPPLMQKLMPIALGRLFNTIQKS